MSSPTITTRLRNKAPRSQSTPRLVGTPTGQHPQAMAIYHRIQDTYFTTATIFNWQPLLTDDDYKSIITDSLDHLTSAGHVRVYAFVIMRNHIHLVWSIRRIKTLSEVKHSLLSYTSHRFLHKIRSDNSKYLSKFYVNKRDRKYQFWQRRSFDIPTVSQPFLLQKIDYVHRNPVKAGLAGNSYDYTYSSAQSYHKGSATWKFLTLYKSEFI